MHSTYIYLLRDAAPEKLGPESIGFGGHENFKSRNKYDDFVVVALLIVRAARRCERCPDRIAMSPPVPGISGASFARPLSFQGRCADPVNVV